MALDINNIKQASPKANQVATEQYVDTSIAGIDVSGDINANNDVFAQKLGYANYQAMVNAAASGQTVINGGYVNTGLIQAGAITSDKIDANAVSGKTISGGIITGTKLYGTQIEGAIIKASYIDLSSTVTLTNWQQYTPANYPSAYDANFAKNNNGTLLVDSQGYVRLMGNTNIITTSSYYTGSNYPGAPTTFNKVFTATNEGYKASLFPYNSYTQSSINRVISQTPTVNLVGFSSSGYKDIVALRVLSVSSGSYVNINMKLFGDTIILSGSNGSNTCTVNGTNIPSTGAYGVPDRSARTSNHGFTYRIGFFQANSLGSNTYGMYIDSNVPAVTLNSSFSGNVSPIEIIAANLRCISTGADGAVYGFMIDIPVLTV